MFAIPGKNAVTMTPAAIKQIAKLMEKEGHQGLRIGVKKGGCAGMEYTMDYADTVDPMDEVVEQDGARVMIAPMAQMFPRLYGLIRRTSTHVPQWDSNQGARITRFLRLRSM